MDTECDYYHLLFPPFLSSLFPSNSRMNLPSSSIIWEWGNELRRQCHLFNYKKWLTQQREEFDRFLVPIEIHEHRLELWIEENAYSPVWRYEWMNWDEEEVGEDRQGYPNRNIPLHSCSWFPISLWFVHQFLPHSHLFSESHVVYNLISTTFGIWLYITVPIRA